MISNLKEKNKINIPLICIVTDYAPHRTWINKNVDAYIVADDKMNLEMVTVGDCIDNFKMKGKVAIINDGKVIGFEEGEQKNG